MKKLESVNISYLVQLAQEPASVLYDSVYKWQK